jgi:hypothetical protein
MAAETMKLQVLISFPNEVEAAAVVNALAEHGIHATATGAYTASFRAEAPGMVRVLVAEDNVSRAREILADIRQENADLDSDQDEEEPPNDSDPSETATGVSDLDRRQKIWRYIIFAILAGLLILIVLAVGVPV